MAQVPKSVAVRWPVGPHYLRWVDGKGIHAWARYKVKSADWYRAALAVAVDEAGDVERFVGIEMALDGALSALCAAVDAAGAGLDEAVRQRVGPDEAGELPAATPGSSALVLALEGGLTLGCERALRRALAGEGTESPTGWLAQLRSLRDHAVRHNVLVRRPAVGDDRPGRFVDVPGLGARRPISYLRESRRRVGDLVELVLADLDALEGERSYDDEAPPRSGPRPLPDLAARARVVGPS